MNNNKVLVIIVTYNGSNFIFDCLTSIQSDEKVCDVLIVDNFSSDETVKIVKENFPNIKLIENKNNLGFGKANNLGFVYGLLNGYDFFFLLNQDTIISESLINRLLKSYCDNNLFGILSPIHFDGLGENLDINFEFFLQNQKKTRIISELFKDVNFFDDKCFEVNFINAAAWFMSRDVVLSIGFFNPIFPHYAEDTDYYNRLIYHNGKTFIFTGGYIRHFSYHSYYRGSWDLLVKFNREKVEIWANLLNINKSLFGSFKFIFFNKLKKIIIFLGYFRIKESCLEFLLLFSTIYNLRKILNLRFQSKNKGAFIS